MTHELQYARQARAPRSYPRWPFYMCCVYVITGTFIMAHFLSDDVSARLATPIKWSDFPVFQRVALFLYERPFLWFACSVFPLYVLSVVGTLYATLKQPVDTLLVAIAAVGVIACCIDVGANLYLSAKAPFVMAAGGATIHLFDRVDWPGEAVRLALTYAPFFVLALTSARRLSSQRHPPRMAGDAWLPK